jgi:hypothetical protein
VADINDSYDNSNLAPTINIAGCVTEAPNHVLPSGASFNDLIGTAILQANSHGARMAALTQLLNGFKSTGRLTGRQFGSIVSCVAKLKSRHGDRDHHHDNSCDYRGGRDDDDDDRDKGKKNDKKDDKKKNDRDR